jgi:hypothetical protein
MILDLSGNVGACFDDRTTGRSNGRVKVEFGLATTGLGEAETWAYFKKTIPELPIQWLRVHRIFWDRFEPAPPRDGFAQYRWKWFDEYIIKPLQEIDVKVVLMVHPTSRWAADPRRYRRAHSGRKSANIPPKPKNMKHWQRALQDLFDRYNYDGKNDMPGLKKPFKHWQIGNEYYDRNLWDGTVQEYIEVLKAAYVAKKRVDPSIEIILAGIDAGRIAKYEASDAVRKKVLRRVGYMTKFIKEMLKYPQYFDFIDVHVFNHFRINPNSIHESMDWLKKQMALIGYSKPYGALEWTASMTFMDSLFREEIRKDFEEKMKIVLSQQLNPHYERISKELEIEQAKDFAKVFVTLVGYGLERNCYVQFRDLPPWWPNPLWDKQGLVRARTRGGRIEEPKPVFYVYKRLLEKLSPWVDAVEKIDVKDGVYAWQFLKEKRKMVVVWSDKNNQEVPLSVIGFDEQEKTKILNLVSGKEKTLESDKIILTDTPVLLINDTGTD